MKKRDIRIEVLQVLVQVPVRFLRHPEVRAHAKGVVLCERARFCLLSAF